MIRYQSWRYRCEHCRKSGASGGHMKRHEASCTLNPARVCRMCKAGGIADEQRPMTELRAALDEGLDKLIEAAQRCPACIMATIKQYRREWGHHDGDWFEWDYKKAAAEWWTCVNQKEDYAY